MQVYLLLSSFRLKELGLPDGEKHPSLGPYYLEYGNALLKNAENSNELFQLERAEETAEQREKSPEQTGEQWMMCMRCSNCVDVLQTRMRARACQMNR